MSSKIEPNDEGENSEARAESRNSKLFLLLSAVGAVGLSICALCFYGLAMLPIPTTERAPASMAPLSENSNSGQALRYQPEAGKRYIYSFERKIDFSGLSHAQIPEVLFHGELHIDVLHAENNGFEALLSETIMEQGGKTSPFLKIVASASGETLKLFKENANKESSDPAEDEQHLSVLKDFVANWLFPLRSDTVGPFVANLEILSEEAQGMRKQRKTKLHYLAKTRNTPQIITSQHILLWNDSLHLPADITGEEETRVGGEAAAFAAHSSYHLKFQSMGAMPPAENAEDLQQEESLDVAKSGNFLHHPDYEKLDWQEIVGRLRHLDDLSAQQQLDTFGDVTKFLRLHPEKSSDLASMLLDPALLALGASSPLFRSLVGALATLGTPEAQNTLISAFSDPATPVNGKGTIEGAFTTTQAPLTDSTLNFLSNQHQSQNDADLANGAGWALGSGLQNAGNSPLATQAIASLQSEWTNALGNTDAEMNLLDIMGNSGRAEFLPDLQAAIENNNNGDALRAKALYALRFMQAPGAAQDLVQYLGSPNSTLRQAAVNAAAAAPWNEAYRSPLTICAASDPLSQVQSSCQKILQMAPTTVASAGH